MATNDTTPLTCRYCGDSASISARMPFHNLCAALDRTGQPLNRMDPCPACSGSGLDPKRGMRDGQSVYNPTGAQMARLFPPCPTCAGSGLAN
jgi:DnaJ-class molecular chaperone